MGERETGVQTKLRLGMLLHGLLAHKAEDVCAVFWGSGVGMCGMWLLCGDGRQGWVVRTYR